MRLCLLLLGLAVSALAQPFSFGVKAGVPLNEAFVDDGGKNFFPSDTSRWVLGPTFELHLPFHLSVEADALYRQYTIGQQVSQWEFPILAKYRAGSGLFRPFIDGGVSFNHVSDVGLLLSTPHSSTAGFVVGGGFELKALFLKLSPELRYTRWKDANIDLGPNNSGLSSNQNQLEFLVGFTF